MNEAAKHFIGTHDFTGFCSQKTEVESKERTLQMDCDVPLDTLYSDISYLHNHNDNETCHLLVLHMNEAAKHFIGTHDFTGFCSQKTEVESKERTLYQSAGTSLGCRFPLPTSIKKATRTRTILYKKPEPVTI
jgi:tRNA U38,U39,U40 pseudouridine synthase TruA